MATIHIYQVVVIPDLDKNRRFTCALSAQNATTAAGVALQQLPPRFRGRPVDCIEVKQGAGPGRQPLHKVAFYCCQYGAELGFFFDHHLVLA